ncbi:hypothetical protein RV10_GL004469 [Enterococcus pallens]|nr:hypothetical protein RV10_GL004469 [Enterococcus pallens]
MLVASLLFPTSPAFAETVQDVPVGETTISSKAEDPLKEYKERAQNQVPMVESVESQDVPGKTSEIETSPKELEQTTGDSPTPTSESSEEQPEMSNQRIEPRGGGIMPLAGTILREGNLGDDPSTYDIDKNFADAIRSRYPGTAPNPMTDDFMESLTSLMLIGKNLTSLKGIEYATNLEFLNCMSNQLSEIDVSNNTALETLDVSLNIGINELDVSSNTALKVLNCTGNQLSKLDVSRNTALTRLICNSTPLSELDVSSNTALKELQCIGNQLSELDVSSNTALVDLQCFRNQLRELDVSGNPALATLNCSNNRISDISSANGLTALTNFDASNQQITIPVPPVSLTDEATVDVLKTTAQTGLTATNVDINPSPSSILPNASNGDHIDLKGVTRDSLSDKSISFEYASSALQEGASTYTTKLFSGTITFAVVSELKNELQVSSNKTKSGEELTWTWTMTSLTQKKAEDIKATFTLPNYLTGDISDIVITKGASSVSGDMNHLNGTTSLGDLEQGESIVITFKSTVRGDPDEWLEAIGRLDWSDTTPSSPHFNESRQSYKILDEEQQDLPKDSADMGILSAPVRFYFGRQQLSSSIETYNLAAQNYQTNTNVVTDGFYTRIKDEQAVSTGWKLTASLSEFKDSGGRAMPNGTGASLKLENMFIQNVTDRDTPQEAIDPSPAGTPTTVQANETLMTGQTAKTLVSAQVGEGQGTWQLRMPFDDISLTLPAGAGKSNTDYTAKLTWSLDDTP